MTKSKRLIATIAFAIASAFTASAGDRTVYSCRKAIDALLGGPRDGSTFCSITGKVVHISRNFGYFSVVLGDSSGNFKMVTKDIIPPPDLAPGDIILSRGIIRRHARGKAHCELLSVVPLGKATPSSPQPAALSRLLDGTCYYQLVRIHGVVRDAFIDDIDPRFAFCVIAEGDDMVFAPFPLCDFPDTRFSELIGAEVVLTGFTDLEILNNRPRIRPMFVCIPGGLRVIRSRDSNPFAATDFSTASKLPPHKLASVGNVCIRGKVVAVWDGCNVLVKTDVSEFSKVALDGKSIPEIGDFIEAVGRPTTDLNYINLFRAKWRRTAPLPITEIPPRSVSASNLIDYSNGVRFIHPDYNGEAIRLEGCLVEQNHAGNALVLSCDGEIVSAHCPFPLDLETGSRIAVTGICLLDSERWSPDVPFPRTRGFRLLARTPADIIVLQTPPWWTPARIFAVSLLLAILLAAVLLWNFLVHRQANRLARDLADSEIEQVTTEFKLAERTRLAVELHDSISQNLTAVGLEIDAARGFFRKTPEETLHHLDVAGSALQSCRNELRNCLWDLRNQTLELPDFPEAIRQTLAQHVGDAKLLVRFPVPREIFTDNTAHNLLRILRELAANAIRHGKATEIRVAGALENGCLLVSVTDNGQGFAIESAPGIAEGHFGLEGIRERAEAMNGTFAVESAPGKGCRAIIRILLHSGGSDT